MWLLVLAIFALFAAGAPLSAEVKLPDLPKAQGESCVEPTDVMRRNHMKFMLHQRDQTVHQGIRTKTHSLVECIACHAVRDDRGEFMRVDAPGQFCEGCHAFAGVKMDCFECHAARPSAETYSDPPISPGPKVAQGNHSHLMVMTPQNLGLYRELCTPTTPLPSGSGDS